MFCFPEYIANEMNKVFSQLRQPLFLQGAVFADFVAGAAHSLAELNAIHPFREGNGRSQLSFVHLLSMRGGHPLRLERIRRATFMPAMVASFGGNLAPLVTELTRLEA